MVSIEFRSSLAPHFSEFLAMKKALGYKYDSGAELLKRFDRFCCNFSTATPSLPKDIVLSWIAKRPNEVETTRQKRVAIVKEFGAFLHHCGIEAYLPPLHEENAPESTFTPYIFTHDQIGKLFIAADKHPSHRAHPISNTMYSVLFRMLYSCGLRISEALRLQYNDVENGILIIRESKFGKNRLVPISGSLQDTLAEYLVLVKTYYLDNPHVFPSRFSNDAIVDRCAYSYFRKLLWEAGIPHGGKGKGPRLHDLRHTFAVHSLQKWIADGVDIYAALPILAKYMGHEHLRMTQRYLRLTAEVYPELTALVERYSGGIIPEVLHEYN